MIKVAIHQPNFIPNYPFFCKMAQSDIFVFLQEVDFEKNGFQNRYFLNTKDKWVTKPVWAGHEKIFSKQYTDGSYLTYINGLWINAIKETLGIKTEIVFDYPTDLTKTERLIDLVKHFGGDTYVTNPSAKDKYLDEELMRSAGIEIEYCRVLPHLQKHIFEVFEEYGIEGAIKNLPKRSNEIHLATV
jgi:hypothetical protein